MLTILLGLIFIWQILSLSFIIGFVYFFLLFLFMFLQVLFFTTCERKILALTQRRLGPQVVGDRGRLQFLADAVKLITKVFFGPKKINGLFFQNSAIIVFWFSWLGCSNLLFENGVDILEVEYNLFFLIFCSLGFGVAWLVAGWASVSKYALMGSIRAGLQIISYEIIMSSIMLGLFIITGNTNFELISEQQEYFSIFLFIPMGGVVAYLATLMETNRPPFDLSEAESDVVAGYTVEYAGILFGLFYLGEYVNLFTSAIILSIIFWGAWWNLLTYCVYFILLIKNWLIFINLDYYIPGVELTFGWK